MTEIPLSARTVRPVVAPMNAISSATASVPISSSMPAYRSSVFSRTTTRSTRPYGDGTPSYRRHGRTFANRSSVCRRRMFALRTPASAGVSIGPFSATRHDRIVSSVAEGRGSPCRAKDRAPISAGTHSRATPVASIVRRAASTTSGPMPSPAMSATRSATMTAARVPGRLSWERDREGHAGGRRRRHEDLRHRRRGRAPVVRRLRDRRPRGARHVRGGRLPPARPRSADPLAADGARCVPEPRARAPSLPGPDDADPRAEHLADVDAPHQHLGGLGVRPRRMGRIPGGRAPQGDAPDREDADADRHLRPPAYRQEARAAEPRPQSRGELPVDAPRRGAGPRGRRRAGHDVHPLRRPHDERLDVHGPGDRLDAVRHVLGDDGRDRRAEGAAARRRERGVAEDGGGGRQARERRGVRPRAPRRAREDHGVRPRRVQDEGPARHDPEGDAARTSANGSGSRSGTRSSPRWRRPRTSRRACIRTSTSSRPASTTSSGSRRT